MKYEIRKIGNITVVVIKGRISSNRIKVSRETILGETAQSSTGKVLIDLEGVEMIDSIGFGFIASIFKTVVSRNGVFAISSANEPMSRKFQILGLTTFFKIYASENEAIRAF